MKIRVDLNKTRVLRQLAFTLVEGLMCSISDKPARKLGKVAFRSAARLRKAEVKLADKWARAEAKATRKLRKAEERWLQAAIEEAAKCRRKHSCERIIRIDLLAEAHEEEELRRNIPIKCAVVMASFCVSVLSLWMLQLQLDINSSLAELHRTQQRLAEISGKYASACDILMRNEPIESKLAAIDRLATNRFLWAPVMASLENSRLHDIRLIRATGEQRLTQEEPRILGSGSSAVVIPGAMVERTSLYLEASDLSSNGLSYLQYKKNLGACDYFVENFKGSAAFSLEGLQKPQVADKAVSGSQGITFVLMAHFPDVRSDN
jgi:hypothetical protein